MRLSEIRLVAAFVVGRALDIIAPPLFGPRQVWGPADPAEGLARAEESEEVWEQPVGEFPLELAEQLRASVPAGGVEPPDSATGGHPVRTTSEVLDSALVFVRNYRLANVGAGHLNEFGIECVDGFIAELTDRAAQFRAAGD